MVTDLNSACICVDMLLDVSNVQEDERLLSRMWEAHQNLPTKEWVCGSSGGRTSFDRVCRNIRSSCSSSCFQEFSVVDPELPPSLGHWGDVYRIMFRVKRRFGESQLRPQMVGLCRSCHCLLGPWEEDLVLSFLSEQKILEDPGKSIVAENWMKQLNCKLYHR